MRHGEGGVCNGDHILECEGLGGFERRREVRKLVIDKRSSILCL